MAEINWFAKDLTELVHPLIAGRVYVVLAPTGTGKTLVGLNQVARAVEDGHKVTVVPTEEAPRYRDLLACRAAGVSFADHFYGRLPKVDREEVLRWWTHYDQHPQLALGDNRSPTIPEIIADVSHTGLPDLLVIDHLHAMGMEGQRLPEFVELAVDMLARIADKGVVVLLLAQVHRPKEQDRLYAYRIPTVSAGLGSNKIEQGTDVVLGASRKLKDKLDRATVARLVKGLLHHGESMRDYEDPNTMRMTVLKHRMDDSASRRSVLLTVSRGKLQDRLAMVNDTAPFGERDRGDAWESPA